MKKADRIRLQHMPEAAREALSFARDRSRADLGHNRMLLHSLVRDTTVQDLPSLISELVELLDNSGDLP